MIRYLALCLVMVLGSTTITALGNYMPNEVLVVSRRASSTGIPVFRNMEDDAGVIGIQELNSKTIHLLNRELPSGRSGITVRRVQLRSGIDPLAFSKQWTSGRISAESIDYVQPNFIYTPSTITPNDPFSSTGNNFVHLSHIDDAWSISTGSSTTIIAVIDTGTNITHEDLVDSLWINTDELDDNLDNDGNGYVDDIYGANTGVTLGSQSSGVVNGDVFHGTHVAGIIAAQLNNLKGIAGVCPGCKIMTIKANLPNLGFFTTASLVAGIDYAIQMGANIINMSLGGSPSSDDALFYAAIQAATRANITSVAAAGNEQDNIDITPSVPAVFPEVIAVSATDGTVFDSSYSNFGSAIWVSAPGTEIASALTGSPNSYGFSSGTSMAAPVVSGVLGLLKSYQPRLTVADLKLLLKLYSDDLGETGHDNFYGYGFINAYRALSAIASDNVFPTIPSSSIPTHCESDASSVVHLIATDNSPVSPSVTATVNFYSNAVLSRTEFPTVNGIAPSTYEFRISTPGLTISRIQLQLSAIDVNNNQTTLSDTDIAVTDLTPPTISTPNTYISDQLSGLVTLNIQDISGVVTASIRVRYTTSSNTSIKTTVDNPSSVSFNNGILGIQLSDFGYVPSVSGTLSIYSADLKGNSGTRNIEIGSTEPPQVTWGIQENDFVGTGSQIKFSVTDNIGVSLNSLSLTFVTATQSQTVPYMSSPSAYIVSLPDIAFSIPNLLLPYSSTFDVRLTIKNRLFAVSTDSRTLKTDSNFAAQTIGSRSQLLAYPNPFNPQSATCKLAYVLTRSAQSGELVVHDLRYRKIKGMAISGAYLLAGYNELPWDGRDDAGDRLPNGTYVVTLVISDSTGTVRLRQKVAVLTQ